MAKAKTNNIGKQLLDNAFWIALGITTIAVIVFWAVGTSTLKSQYEENRSRRMAEANRPREVQDNEPNEQWRQTLRQQVEERQHKALAVWQVAYERQLPALTWPNIEYDGDRVARNGLTPGFHREVEKLPPPEWLNLDGRRDDLPAALREEYRNFGRTQIAHLCEIMTAPYRLSPEKKQSKWAAGIGGLADDVEERLRPNELVDWSSTSQRQAEEHLTFAGPPSTQQVLYAQEDFWVFKSIAQAIARTNEAVGAEGNYNAAIKRIHSIRVADRYDGVRKRNVFRIKKDEEAAEGRRREAKKRAAERDQDQPEAEQIEVPPLLNAAKRRYCDALGKRLTDRELVKLRNGKAEFKRMPVFLRLDVDQRHLDKLLVELTQSRLNLEIRQVRLDIDQSDDDSSRGPDRAIRGLGMSGDESRSDGKSFYDISVDLHLFAYFYYPPAEPVDEAQDDDAAYVDSQF